jgi:hypothetical protein
LHAVDAKFHIRAQVETTTFWNIMQTKFLHVFRYGG